MHCKLNTQKIHALPKFPDYKVQKESQALVVNQR